MTNHWNFGYSATGHTQRFRTVVFQEAWFDCVSLNALTAENVYLDTIPGTCISYSTGIHV